MNHDDQAVIFRALANPDRVAIMDYVAAHQPVTVATLCKAIGCTQPTTSKHLVRMRGAGLIKSDWQGISLTDRIRWPLVTP